MIQRVLASGGAGGQRERSSAPALQGAAHELPLLERFGHIHHRFLNHLDQMDSLAQHAHRRSGVVELAEGDVCWRVDGRRVDTFLWHPDLATTLGPHRLRRGLPASRPPQLAELLVPRYASLPFVVELKLGWGDPRRGVEAVLEQLETHKQGNYWIDSFSPRLLRLVKDICPAVPTSLHTSWLWGQTLLKTALEPVPLSLWRLPRLDFVDALTVSFPVSPAHLLGRLGVSPQRLHGFALAQGYGLVLGGVRSERMLASAKAAGAAAAYVPFERDAFARPPEPRAGVSVREPGSPPPGQKRRAGAGSAVL